MTTGTKSFALQATYVLGMPFPFRQLRCDNPNQRATSGVDSAASALVPRPSPGTIGDCGEEGKAMRKNPVKGKARSKASPSPEKRTRGKTLPAATQNGSAKEGHTIEALAAEQG